MRAPTAGMLIGMFLVQLLVSNHMIWAQTSPPLRQRIPKPNPKKYRSMQDARDWHNPQLIVRPEGIEIIGITPAGQAIPIESVSDKLEQLPDSAWPYGLIVMVVDAGVLSSDKDVPNIQANRSKLLKVLKEHGIAADLRPSA